MLLGGKGTFEATLARLGLAFTLASFVTWIPDTVGAVLNLTGMVSTAEWIRISNEPGFWYVFAQLHQWVGGVRSLGSRRVKSCEAL